MEVHKVSGCNREFSFLLRLGEAILSVSGKRRPTIRDKAASLICGTASETIARVRDLNAEVRR